MQMRTIRTVRTAAVVAAAAVLLAACGPTPAPGDAADGDEPDVAEPDPEPDPEPEPEPDPDPEPAPDPEPDDPAPEASGDLEVHFIDVGQADATLLVHDDATMLIDTGDWQRSDVIGYLDQIGVDQLDVVAITHPHADHIGQFDRAMGTFDVAEVWWPGTVTTSQTFERAVAALEASDAVYEEPRAGDATTVGPLQVDIVGPDDDANFSDVHDAGLSMRVTYGDVSFLFTGDIEAAAERRMVSRWADTVVADVYQVGHHGSDTSSTPPLVDLLAGRMQVAVVSVGTPNSYGHPSNSVLSRLAATGADVYRTDENGTVIVTTDGTSLSVTTTGEPAPSAPAATAPAPAPAPEPAPDNDGSAAGGCVDLNSADVDALEDIAHIGESRAAAIISGRPWKSVRSLTEISGIGPARIADIEAQGVACVR